MVSVVRFTRQWHKSGGRVVAWLKGHSCSDIRRVPRVQLLFNRPLSVMADSTSELKKVCIVGSGNW